MKRNKISSSINYDMKMIHALIRGDTTQTRRCVHASDNFNCPYGKINGILWVREVHAKHLGKIVYKADNPSAPLGWIAPRYMKEEESRFRLQIQDITIDRLQNITEKDAIAEGIIKHSQNKYSAIGSKILYDNAIDAYQEMWDSFGNKFSWDYNPFVWAIDFKIL